MRKNIDLDFKLYYEICSHVDISKFSLNLYILFNIFLQLALSYELKSFKNKKNKIKIRLQN